MTMDVDRSQLQSLLQDFPEQRVWQGQLFHPDVSAAPLLSLSDQENKTEHSRVNMLDDHDLIGECGAARGGGE
jgi:hypothetical protein